MHVISVLPKLRLNICILMYLKRLNIIDPTIRIIFPLFTNTPPKLLDENNRTIWFTTIGKTLWCQYQLNIKKIYSSRREKIFYHCKLHYNAGYFLIFYLFNPFTKYRCQSIHSQSPHYLHIITSQSKTQRKLQNLGQYKDMCEVQ